MLDFCHWTCFIFWVVFFATTCQTACLFVFLLDGGHHEWRASGHFQLADPWPNSMGQWRWGAGGQQHQPGDVPTGVSPSQPDAPAHQPLGHCALLIWDSDCLWERPCGAGDLAEPGPPSSHVPADRQPGAGRPAGRPRPGAPLHLCLLASLWCGPVADCGPSGGLFLRFCLQPAGHHHWPLPVAVLCPHLQLRADSRLHLHHARAAVGSLPLSGPAACHGGKLPGGGGHLQRCAPTHQEQHRRVVCLLLAALWPHAATLRPDLQDCDAPRSPDRPPTSLPGRHTPLRHNKEGRFHIGHHPGYLRCLLDAIHCLLPHRRLHLPPTLHLCHPGACHLQLRHQPSHLRLQEPGDPEGTVAGVLWLCAGQRGPACTDP